MKLIIVEHLIQESQLIMVFTLKKKNLLKFELGIGANY